jgi:hypothetical protein
MMRINDLLWLKTLQMHDLVFVRNYGVQTVVSMERQRMEHIIVDDFLEQEQSPLRLENKQVQKQILSPRTSVIQIEHVPSLEMQQERFLKDELELSIDGAT